MIGAGWARAPAAPFVALGAVLLVATIVAWLPAGAPEIPAPPPGGAHKVADTAKAAEERDTDDWSETILARPLFAIGRRPVKVTSGPHQAAGASLPRLAGIMISPFGKRAIFMPDGGKPLVLAEGARLEDGSVVRSITTDRVTLSGTAGDIVLTPALDKQRSNLGPATGTSPFLPGVRPPGFTPPPFTPPVPFQPGFQPPVLAPTPDENPENDSGPVNQPSNTPQMVQPQMRPPFLQPGMRGPMVPHGRE